MKMPRRKTVLEAMRKSIHLSSLIIPFSYRYLFHNNQGLMFRILLILSIIAIIIELFRLEKPTFKRIFHKLFGLILRRHEMKDFTGATYMMVSSVLCVAFLKDPDICFCALSFLSIGDTFAAMVGMTLGKRKFIGMKKSLEGSLACFLSTFAFALFFVNPLIALVGALAATLSELWNIPVDDNLKIPLLSGLVMLIFSIFV